MQITGDVITSSYGCAIAPASPQSLPAGDPVAFTCTLTLNPGNLPVPGVAVSLVVADLNGDATVNGADLAIPLGAWGSAGLGDLNGDDTVDGTDLALLLGAWGPC